MVTTKPRISASYTPGKGDGLYTNSLQNTISYKGDCTTDFYLACEELQVSLSELLLQYKQETGSEYSPISHISVDLLHIISDLMAFRYLEGFSTRSLRRDTVCRVEGFIAKYQKTDAESQEFQYFYKEDLLCRINKVRVAVRKVEAEYKKWVACSTVQEIKDRYYQFWLLQHVLPRQVIFLFFPNLSAKLVNLKSKIQNIDDYGAFLNKLSSFYWIALRQETRNKEQTPIYWDSNNLKEYYALQ